MARIKTHATPCTKEGAVLEWCNTCNSGARHIRDCDIHERCTRGDVYPNIQGCVNCSDYTPDAKVIGSKEVSMQRKEQRQAALKKILEAKAKRVEARNAKNTGLGKVSESVIIAGQKQGSIAWEYGVTTVEARRHDLLPKTLESLHNAGFNRPRLFVDGSKDAKGYEDQFGLDITVRYPNIRTFGNWYLSLQELYIRNANADMYAIFQDDIICCKGLREYIEHTPYPDKGYLNLITYPQNEVQKRLHFKELPEGKSHGWYPSNQLGKGAQGLVFSRAAVVVLLAHQHMIDRPQDERRGWRGVDGGIVTAFKKAGWMEYVHSPSLVRHTGEESTMGNPEQPVDLSFRGENWDARSLIDGWVKEEVKRVELPMICDADMTGTSSIQN